MDFLHANSSSIFSNNSFSTRQPWSSSPTTPVLDPVFSSHDSLRSWTLGTGTFVSYYDDEELEEEVVAAKKKFSVSSMFKKGKGRKDEVDNGREKEGGRAHLQAALQRVAHKLHSLRAPSTKSTKSNPVYPSSAEVPTLSRSSSLSSFALSILSFTSSLKRSTSNKNNKNNETNPPRRRFTSDGTPILLANEELLFPPSPYDTPLCSKCPALVLTPPAGDDLSSSVDSNSNFEAANDFILNDVNLLQLPTCACKASEDKAAKVGGGVGGRLGGGWVSERTLGGRGGEASRVERTRMLDGRILITTGKRRRMRLDQRTGSMVCVGTY